ncbi:MAG: putative Fe-S cluster assembly protein SufT [Gammaproteobacteria bacterium]|jgi:probable FeS assembly SUF system protein SufT|nr:putative Fe-S cluster assembly protein SufT [Gammaproteobacteria bacterium]
MNNPQDFNNPITLLRDCEAVLIPEGSPVTLTKGTAVYVTQALGGSVTVNVNGNLARIPPRNVDAIGLEVETLPADAVAASGDGTIDEALLWEQLRTCYDPEIPINIVELGLIYRCEVYPIEGGGNRVDIDMTLTAPGCGMGPFLVDDVEHKLALIPNVSEVKVELVFDPMWNPEMMSDAARLQTGLY